MEKLCYQCDTIKPLTEFGKQSAAREGLKRNVNLMNLKERKNDTLTTTIDC
jgi:hypothetical protein